jgi:uncharacterized protein YutE (UPF0331/DUF86 family)
MSPVERDVARRKLDRIVKCLQRIRQAQALTLDEYLHDADLQSVMERQLELAIGAAVDLNIHLLSQLGFGTPADSYSSYIDLAKHTHMISPELARQLAPGAGLRNRLAHEYEDLDHRQVYAGLHQALKLFPPYVEAVEAFLSLPGSGEPSS